MARPCWNRCCACLPARRKEQQGSDEFVERGSDWFERYLVPPLGGLASSVYLQAIRDAFIIFTLPLIIAGSVFLVLANPPIPALASWIAPYQTDILVPYELSFGLMAVFLAFGVGYS